MSRIKVAVVGGGAAGFGALLGLSRSPERFDVTLFDGPPGVTSPHQPSAPMDDVEDPRAYARHLRSVVGRSFPPPKTHFGVAPTAQVVEHWGRVWKSVEQGGLTRFWGAAAIPYPDEEFDAWPFNAAEFRRHYEAVVSHVAVAGGDDAFSAAWGHGLASREPLRRLPIFERLHDVLRAPGLAGDREPVFDAGSGRVAVETDATAPDACDYRGACMSGCPRDAVFSAEKGIGALRAGLAFTRVSALVERVDRDTREVVVRDRDGTGAAGRFDHVLLCAGALGTTEIVLKSGFGLRGAEILDSALATFPIFYPGSRLQAPIDERYFSLTNLFVSARLGVDRRRLVLQLYPVFDFLWEAYLPRGLWPAFRGLGSRLRRHAIIARVYFPSAQARRYRMTVGQDGRMRLALSAAPDPFAAHPDLLPRLAGALRSGGFHVPRRLRISQKTSSHYGASLPMGAGLTSAESRIASGIHVCDGAAFPELSAYSPTLTIMALAHRVASRLSP